MRGYGTYTVHAWGLDDSFVKCALSFHLYVGSGDQIQVFRILPGLKLTVLLPQAPTCWDYRSVRPCLQKKLHFTFSNFMDHRFWNLLCS